MSDYPDITPSPAAPVRCAACGTLIDGPTRVYPHPDPTREEWNTLVHEDPEHCRAVLRQRESKEPCHGCR